MIKSVGSRLEKENKEPYNYDAIVTFPVRSSKNVVFKPLCDRFWKIKQNLEYFKYMNFDLPPTDF